MPAAFPAPFFSSASFRWAVGTALSRCIPASSIPGRIDFLFVPELAVAKQSLHGSMQHTTQLDVEV